MNRHLAVGNIKANRNTFYCTYLAWFKHIFSQASNKWGHEVNAVWITSYLLKTYKNKPFCWFWKIKSPANVSISEWSPVDTDVHHHDTDMEIYFVSTSFCYTDQINKKHLLIHRSKTETWDDLRDTVKQQDPVFVSILVYTCHWQCI